jgi:UDP-2-acetamido-2,6-beta-L-arabino-hexul-4-ose reductase
MRIVITGGGGFIGANLRARLREAREADVVSITRGSTREQFTDALKSADFVFHVAGVNRPQTETEFVSGNVGLTEDICETLEDAGRRVPIAFTSSTQAGRDNPYGRSKRAAEEVLQYYSRKTGAPVYIARLTNVFGKWARPDYNSAVATFCHNLARGLPITINDAAAPLNLVYIDDVAEAFISLLASPPSAGEFLDVAPVYNTTVGEVADMIRGFAQSRETLLTGRVGAGLARALHATYLSYLPPASFVYQVPTHDDPRGSFAEILKTPDCGQFSYFTARPGEIRGGHYHHSKTEKFIVIRGRAKFRFRHIETDERYEISVRGGDGRIVETVPGWAHDIANVGDDELVVMLWANENFDPERPDTIRMEIGT